MKTLNEEEIKATQALRYERMYDATKNASNVIRQLSFSGIACVWMFKSDFRNGSFLIFIALFLFIFNLIIDVFLYWYTAEKYEKYAREVTKIVMTKELKDTEQIINPMPQSVYKITNCLWYTKIISVIAAYILIAILFMINFCCNCC